MFWSDIALESFQFIKLLCAQFDLFALEIYSCHYDHARALQQEQNNIWPSTCVSVFVCRVPLGVLFWVLTTPGLSWFASSINVYRLVSWIQCSSCRSTIFVPFARGLIFFFWCSHHWSVTKWWMSPPWVISNITWQPSEPTTTKTPALDDNSTLVYQRHHNTGHTIHSAAQPPAPPIPPSGATASTVFLSNQPSSAFYICCQTVPDNSSLHWVLI